MLLGPAGEWALLNGESSGAIQLGNARQKEGAGQATTCSSSQTGAVGHLGGWIKSFCGGMGVPELPGASSGSSCRFRFSQSGELPGLDDGKGGGKEGLGLQNCGQELRAVHHCPALTMGCSWGSC